jgi:thioredoxin reductase (NADPH)
MAQVMASAAAGMMAGAGINGDLITEETRQAVAARSS